MKRISIGILTVFWAGGCASLGGWHPVVDRRMDGHPETVDQDLAECREMANQSSGGTVRSAAKGTAVGAAGGAAIGAILGAVSGQPARGAAVGAALGGTGGAATQGFNAEEVYKRAYVRCMEGRGHRVINNT